MATLHADDGDIDRLIDRLVPVAPRRPPRSDDDRPPYCPTCHRRLVILTTQVAMAADGTAYRYQLWGCPRGHSTSRRVAGSFQGVQVLPDLLADDSRSG